MPAPILYTIGHSNHPADRFAALLKAHGIRLLADIRSQPASRFLPQFNRAALAPMLEASGIAYRWLGDRLGGADRGAYARIPAIAFLVAAPCYAVGVLSNSLPLTYAMFLIPQALGLMWLGPVLSAVQHIAPASMRTTASASFLFINNLIGIGVGTVLIGWISEQLAPSFGDQSLRYSILIGLSFYLLSAALFFLASRRLHRDWAS